MKKEMFIEQCILKRNDMDEYDILEEEFICDHKVKFYHKTCGREFLMKASNFKALGYRCPLCYGNRNKVNYELVKNDINSVEGYTLISTEYKNNKSDLIVHHDKCNKDFTVSWNSWKHDGVRCKVCAGNMRLGGGKMAENIAIFDDHYISTDTSGTNAHSKIKILHKDCGNEFLMQYNNFKNGQRCPICRAKNASANISKGASDIFKILDKNQILYECEKTYPDLISPTSNKKLRYDIYIPDINLLIEYQGIQHFTYYQTGYFNKENYDKIKLHDEIKNHYAISNNINIEYINYDDDGFTKLKEILNQYGKDIVEN